MMTWKNALLLACFFFVTRVATAQINLYIGGNLQGNYSWMRGEDHTFQPGFGGGFNFVYWEYEYWFLKAGLDYSFKTSSSLQFPEDFDAPIETPDDKIRITYSEQTVGIPLAIYFRPWESGANALLISGSFALSYTVSLKQTTEEYGELVQRGKDINSRMKTNVGVGAGFQRQLDRHTYLNIIPSFQVDIRSPRAYQSIILTAELIFGIY